jgi:UDP-glucose 4,6-dehydratase
VVACPADNSFGNSFQFTETNVLGTHVLLEAAKLAGVRLFIHVSTDEVYGEAEVDGPASHEGSSLEPTNPYAASKAGAEYLVKAYHRSFSLPTIITRGNNVYGSWACRPVFPSLLCSLLRWHMFFRAASVPREAYPQVHQSNHARTEAVRPALLAAASGPVFASGFVCCRTLHGTGQNTRNYLYVEDVARAFDIVFHKGVVGHVYNIGSSNEVSNVAVARSLLRLMDKCGSGMVVVIALCQGSARAFLNGRVCDRHGRGLGSCCEGACGSRP